MSENVSSSVLFHFTNSVDHLKSILKDGFFPHYCAEYSLDPADRKEASRGRPPMHAAPMVCFCDLPLSLVSKHVNEYGNFAIGLEKHWGLKNGLAPVIYTHSKAQTRRLVLRLATKSEETSDEETGKDMMFLAAYTKPFEGPAWRKRMVHKKVKFYDEREWRYVPVVRKGQPLFLAQKDYVDVSKKRALEKRLKKQNVLRIHPDDIQYLIVAYDRDENNILELHDYVMRLYARRYSRRDAKLVTTTIMTVDRIEEDI